MADFLLELFSEEIPARFQAGAEAQLREKLTAALTEARLEYSSLNTFSSPRHLAVMVEGLPAVQPDQKIERKGPKINAPQAAIDGFLKSTGLTVEQLEKRSVGKDEVYFAIVEEKGKPTASALQAIIEPLLQQFHWPKSMRWGGRPMVWARPLHAILCLLDETVIPVAFGHLTAGRTSFGHRFLSPGAIDIRKPADYVEQLRKAYVLVNREERRDRILSEAASLASQHGLTPKRDDGLLEEVTGLVEWPVPLLGEFADHFMTLPPEVLTSEMRHHQKYFALQKTDGSLSNHFLTIGNMINADGGVKVIDGNRRVLLARLADGQFYWDQDRKTKLDDWSKGLSDVTFHAKIGTLAEKIERIKTLALRINESVGASQAQVERAALLCKADLVTGMVGEFPDLQGIMGRYYATAQGEDAQVADAIRDHYLPLGPDSPVPTEKTAIVTALADKFDTLISMFAIGEKPTGSKDPFALRRAALGIIRIILENNLRLPLRNLLNDELLGFFADRLKVMLKDQGIRHDIIAAVYDNGTEDDFTRLVAKATALQALLDSADGVNLLAAYRRASNILTAEEKRDKARHDGAVDPALLTQAEEQALSLALSERAPQVAMALEHEKYELAMRELAALRPAIDAFFDKVLVNAEDAAVRANRLRLLATIRAELNKVANFSLIEG